MILAYSSAHAKQFLQNFLGMKSADVRIVPKLLNFEPRQRRMDIAQEILNTFNDDTDLLKKGHNW